MVKRRLRFWSIPVTENLDDRVQKALLSDSHVTKSDFVRDAVREKLTKLNTMPSQTDQTENRQA